MKSFNRIRRLTEVVGDFIDENGLDNITIADIAKEMGVSKTTVSRAISGKGRIGNETREKILKYIEKYAYLYLYNCKVIFYKNQNLFYNQAKLKSTLL